MISWRSEADISERILPNLVVLDLCLQHFAENDPSVRVLTADSRISGKIESFAARFPDRVVEVGIAEQNLVGVAAGLASCGKKPFVISPACFLTARALEQIKVDVAYCGNAVRLIGISAGISYGPLGASHHAISDFASLRAVPGVTIIAPADNCETVAALEYAYKASEPVYIRLGKRPVECVHGSRGLQAPISSAAVLREGSDVLLLSVGETVNLCVVAAREMDEVGISTTVVSVPMVRPLDASTLTSLCGRHQAVIVVEEHSVHGGLGEAVAAVLMKEGARIRFGMLGIPDEPIMNGGQLEVLAYYGISAAGISDMSVALLAGAS